MNQSYNNAQLLNLKRSRPEQQLNNTITNGNNSRQLHMTFIHRKYCNIKFKIFKALSRQYFYRCSKLKNQTFASSGPSSFTIPVLPFMRINTQSKFHNRDQYILSKVTNQTRIVVFNDKKLLNILTHIRKTICDRDCKTFVLSKLGIKFT